MNKKTALKKTLSFAKTQIFINQGWESWDLQVEYDPHLYFTYEQVNFC